MRIPRCVQCKAINNFLCVCFVGVVGLYFQDYKEVNSDLIREYVLIVSNYEVFEVFW